MVWKIYHQGSISKLSASHSAPWPPARVLTASHCAGCRWRGGDASGHANQAGPPGHVWTRVACSGRPGNPGSRRARPVRVPPAAVRARVAAGLAGPFRHQHIQALLLQWGGECPVVAGGHAHGRQHQQGPCVALARVDLHRTMERIAKRDGKGFNGLRHNRLQGRGEREARLSRAGGVAATTREVIVRERLCMN